MGAGMVQVGRWVYSAEGGQGVMGGGKGSSDVVRRRGWKRGLEEGW